jgi:hypothetical protein
MQMHMDLAMQAYTRSECNLGMDSGINLDVFVNRQLNAIILIVFILELYRVCSRKEELEVGIQVKQGQIKYGTVRANGMHVLPRVPSGCASLTQHPTSHLSNVNFITTMLELPPSNN